MEKKSKELNLSHRGGDRDRREDPEAPAVHAVLQGRGQVVLSRQGRAARRRPRRRSSGTGRRTRRPTASSTAICTSRMSPRTSCPSRWMPTMSPKVGAVYQQWSKPEFVGTQEDYWIVLPEGKARVKAYVTLLKGPTGVSLDADHPALSERPAGGGAARARAADLREDRRRHVQCRAAPGQAGRRARETPLPVACLAERSAQ